MTSPIRAFLALLLALLAGCAPSPQAKGRPLLVFCAANLKKPVEAAAQQFLSDTGVEVQLQFGGSGTLISQLRAAKLGDLFLASDQGSMEDAKRLDLVREILPLAKQHPVIAVQAGNPKHIRTLDDLLRPDVRVALANPEAASIGRVTSFSLHREKRRLHRVGPAVRQGHGHEANGHRNCFRPLFGNDRCRHHVRFHRGPVSEAGSGRRFPIARTRRNGCRRRPRLHHATHGGAAVRPLLGRPGKGGTIFKANGLAPAGGDAWAARPELILYSGGVNRLAIEGLLHQFADREGVDLTTVFNGCGILCATMKTMGDASNPKFPDAYYACDLCFVPPVAEQFKESVLLTETAIGIAVPHGNPSGVKTLADLGRPGLRLGICNAEQSTLGYMTRGILKSSGLSEALRKNVAVEVPTADFLINQLRAGGLDAVIVYQVNAQSAPGALQFIPIVHEGAKAVQPFAVRDSSPHRQLGLRLLAFLRRNKASFENAGFVWRGDAEPIPSASIEIPAWLSAK